MIALNNAWHDVLLVWTFFTRIPAPHFMTERKLSGALWALPLVGAVIVCAQLLVVLVSFAFVGWWHPWVIAVILVLVSLVTTGGLHWDGLADFFDGLGVGKTRRSEAMRDSSLGTFGALGLIVLFSLQVSAYKDFVANGLLTENQTNLGAWLPAAFLAAFLSRSYMGFVWAVLPPMDSTSQVTRFGKPSLIAMSAQLILSILLCAWFGSSFWHLLMLVGALTFWIGFTRRMLDGINGDGLGAAQVISETLVLLVLLNVYVGSQ